MCSVKIAVVWYLPEYCKCFAASETNKQKLKYCSSFQVWCQSMTDSALLNQVLTNPHSPAKYRVLGPLSNSPDFIEQYQCKAGTPMNRPEKCVLW